MADKTQRELDIERILTASTRDLSMTIWQGVKAVTDVSVLASQFASLGGDSFSGDTTDCYENLPVGAVAITRDELYRAKAALVNVAALVNTAIAGIDPADWAIIETLNVRS